MTVEHRTPDCRADRFDYGSLTAEHADAARSAAQRIKAADPGTALETPSHHGGRDMSDVTFSPARQQGESLTENVTSAAPPRLFNADGWVGVSPICNTCGTK